MGKTRLGCSRCPPARTECPGLPRKIRRRRCRRPRKSRSSPACRGCPGLGCVVGGDADDAGDDDACFARDEPWVTSDVMLLLLLLSLLLMLPRRALLVRYERCL